MSGEQVQEISQETARAATAKLAELQAQPEWNAKLVSKTEGWPEKREFAALMAASSKDTAKGNDRLDKIVNGTAEIPFMETTTAGQISTKNAMEFAATLKGFGLTEAQTKQALAGKPVSRAEYDAVMVLRGDRLGSKEWSAKLIAGDVQANRELQLFSMVKANGYEGQEARP